MNSSQDVLYFPTIEFQSIGWLKATLLVWDHVYRIVPRHYTPNDNNEVKEAFEAGKIRNIYLEKEDTSEAYSTFVNLIQNLKFIPAGLDSNDIEQIHDDKIDSRLYPILEKQANAFKNDHWVNISSELARGYMFQLSEIVSRRRGLTKATNSVDAWVTSQYFSEKGNFDEFIYDNSTANQLAYFNFKGLIPISVENVAMKDILTFSTKYSDERKLFHIRVADFLTEIEKCESKDHLEFIMHDYWNELRIAKNDFRKSMGFANQNDLHGLFTVAVPVAATILGLILTINNHPSILNLLEAVGIGSVSALFQQYKDNNNERSKNYAAYLLDLDKNLASKNHIYNFRHIMDEFIND